MAQTVNNLSSMWEIQVRFLGQKDPPEKGMATHSSILAWKIRMDRGTWRTYSPWSHKTVDTTEQLNNSINEKFII